MHTDYCSIKGITDSILTAFARIMSYQRVHLVLDLSGLVYLLAAALEWELFHSYKAIIPLTQPYHSNTTPT